MSEEMTIEARKHCEVCEQETDWTRQFSDHLWCVACGCSKEMLEPDNDPGGCPKHPNSTHEMGYGLAAGSCGVYSICNECGAFFDVHPDSEVTP